MKRTIIFYLLFCLVTPLTTEAKKKPFGNGLFWELNDAVLIISGTGPMPDFPFYEDKRPWGKKKIKRIVIEEGITHIGDNSFQSHNYQYGIQNVSISQSVKTIGEDAFFCCQLTSVSMPSITSIGYGAFCCCEQLSSVKFSNDLISIGSHAFASCYSLSSIDIPQSVEIIGNSAFDNCEKLTSVIIPTSVKTIGAQAFAGCNNLKSISIPNSVTVIGDDAFSERYDHGFISDVYRGKILCLPKWLVDKGIDEWKKCGLPEYSVKLYMSGVHDNDGKLILEEKYGRSITKGDYSYNGLYYYVVSEDGKNGIINSKGIWVIPLDKDYSEIILTNNGYIKVKQEKGYGILSLIGKEIIPTSRGYTSIGDYDSSKGTFAFTKKGFSGVCDAQGREISATELAPTADDIKTNAGYASAVEMKNGSTKYYKVSKSGKYGLTDANGKEIVPCEMEALESAGSGYLKYKINGFWGVMNYTGTIIIDTDRGYTSIGDFVTFTKRFPYTMAGYKGECDINGQQISKIKVETPQQSVASSSSSSSSSTSSSSSSNNSRGTTQTVVVEHHRDPIPVQEWQPCMNCMGEGKVMCLGACGGTGTYYVGNRLNICSSCNGSGKKTCPNCFGQGGQYITVYR